MKSWALAGVVIAACAAPLLGCRTEGTLVTPDPHLERMLKQEKAVAYDDDPTLPNRMVMQHPPEGTMPVETELGPAAWSTGVEGATDPPQPTGGRWVTHIPVHVDRTLVETGHRRFEVFCAPCHGVLGDASSIVADKMTLRRPENLVGPRVRGYADGRIFQTIRSGYGLMPSYAVQLSVSDAWAVTAYVRALQIARGTPVAELPAALRAEHDREAP